MALPFLIIVLIYNRQFKKIKMLVGSSASKLTILHIETTPAKLTVDYEINSWNETHNKHKVVYRHRQRKILKAAQESQSKHVKNSTNLAQLRSYRDNLLKSSTKKLSKDTLPTASPLSDPPSNPPSNPPSAKISNNGKNFRFYIRSIGKKMQLQQRPIIISEFDPKEDGPTCQQKTSELGGTMKVKGAQKSKECDDRSFNFQKRWKSGHRCKSEKPVSHSDASIGKCTKLGNPNGISLIARRLVSSRC